MRFQETEVVELKAMVQDDIKKEIIAFTNCNGGTVYIGVADNGDILGVENADECALQISNMVRDAIKPDVTMFIHYETLNCDGREFHINQCICKNLFYKGCCINAFLLEKVS